MPEQKDSVSLLSKIKNSKYLPIYLGVGFLVIIAFTAGIIAFQTKDNTDGQGEKGDIVFTIEGKKYYRNDVLSLVKYQTEIQGITDDDALSQAYELKKEIAATEKTGITPSQSEINTEKDRLITSDLKKTKDFNTKYQQWFDELAKLNAAKRYVGGEFSPSQKGYVLLFYYEPANETYAKDRAEYYKQQLSSGDISAAKAVKEISQDVKIAPPKGFVNHFGVDQVKTWEEEIGQRSIRDYIKSLKNTGTASDIQSGSNESGLPGSYYYLVFMDEIPSSKVVSIDEFNNTLNSLNASYSGFTLSASNSGSDQK